jgi:membrane-associated phospholipid phosphatase
MNTINPIKPYTVTLYLCLFLTLSFFSQLNASINQLPLTSISYYETLIQSGINTTFSPLTWTEKEWKTTSLVIGSGLVSYIIETDIKKWVDAQNSNLINTMGNLGDSFGSPYLLLPLTASIAGYGFLSNNTKLTDTSVQAFSAGIITGGLTKGIKALFNRHRPSSGDAHDVFDGPSFSGSETSQSFPSGHSSVTWAMSTIFSENYKDNSIIYYGSYGFATFISVSRAFQNEHWVSDIIIGSAIGHFIAKSILEDYKISNSLKFSPVITESTVGGTLNF